jgi:hypothetical protein
LLWQFAVVQQGKLSVGVMHFAVEQPSKKE